MFNRIKTFFRNLKLWFPILVSDQQWDDYYLHKVVYHKLKLMKDFHESDAPMAVEEHTNEVIKEINDTLEPLNRVLEGDYIHFPEDMKPELERTKVESYYEGDCFSVNLVYHEDFGKDKVDEVYKKAEEDEEEDLKKSYNNIIENSGKWWD